MKNFFLKKKRLQRNRRKGPNFYFRLRRIKDAQQFFSAKKCCAPKIACCAACNQPRGGTKRLFSPKCCAHATAQQLINALMGTWYTVMRQARGSEVTEAVFCLSPKKPLHTGVRTGCHYDEARPKERSDRARFYLQAKKLLHTRVRTGCHCLISLSVRLSVCVTFVVFTDREICTRPISTNPGFTEAGEYGLTRGWCFDANRLVVVAVAGLLWISWCVLGGADFFLCVFDDFFFLRKYTGCSKYEPLASFTSLLVPGWVQGPNIYLVCLFVCMCNIRRFY